MDYYIIKFIEEDDAVAVVPKTWIVGDSCYWPPPPNDVVKLTKKYAEPDLEKWKPCKSAIIGKSFGSYKEARENLKNAQYTSDFEGICNSVKPKKGKLVVLPPPPTIQNNFDQENSTGNQVEVDFRTDNLLSPGTEPEDNVVFVRALFTEDKEVQTVPCDVTQLLRIVKGISLTLAEHGQILRRLLDGASMVGSKAVSRIEMSGELNEFTFPLSIPSDLEKLNNKTNTKEAAKTDLIIILSAVKGTDEGTIVNKMLGKLMTDGLQSQYSLKGMRGKLSFYLLTDIRDAIMKGVKLQLDPKIPDEDKIDTAISDALAKAAGRLYQRDKKSKSVNITKPAEPSSDPPTS